MTDAPLVDEGAAGGNAAPREKIRVSFCTTCMGRRHHLEQVYVQNIQSALTYENVEFVLLDYSSRDELAEWVRRELRDWLERGIVRYFRTVELAFFHMAHAKNVAHRLATGDVLVNLDADNWFEAGFAEETAAIFQGEKQLVARFPHAPPGCAGRIGVRRSDFLALGGYDEALIGWGYEDKDFLQRAYSLGLRRRSFEDCHAHALRHSNAERVILCPGRRGHQRENRARSIANVTAQRFVANAGREWGVVRLVE